MPQDPVEATRYLYEQIYKVLKEEILSGKYGKGDWFPPERVLKDRFNTTHLTVRNALAKLVLEGYIERYSGKGTIVIYARRPVAAPRRLLTFPWAHLIVESVDEAGAALVETIEAFLRKVPLPLRLSCHHGDVLLGQSMYREARESGALIIFQPFGVKESPTLPDLALENTIAIGSPLADAECPQIVTDDEEGGRKAVRHFLDFGYRKIALLVAGLSSHGARLARGLEELADPGTAGIVQPCGPGVDGGEQAVRNVLARDAECRAFLCSSDVTAAGASAGLRREGLQPGRDCAVVGYGNTPLAASMRLTSIDPRVDLLAERTIAAALEAMSRGSFVKTILVISPELCVRESSARATPLAF
ncbi:MAG TPA: GntR family transcriptional regulator [Spirochaetia bacterium]|nr:GntR family transcriptional regulator [Spirochaetia bacterium]